MHGDTTDCQTILAEALLQLNCALQLLDRANAPAHIGAHVDLAIHQLTSVVDAKLGPHLGQMDRNAELQ